jgi:hypothetical protein
MAAASASSLLSPPLIESIAAACPVDGAAAEAAVVPPLAALGLTLAALGLTSVALGLALADEADWLVAAAAMCVICKCVTCMVAVVCERECMCVCVCVCVVGGATSVSRITRAGGVTQHVVRRNVPVAIGMMRKTHATEKNYMHNRVAPMCWFAAAVCTHVQRCVCVCVLDGGGGVKVCSPQHVLAEVANLQCRAVFSDRCNTAA